MIVHNVEELKALIQGDVSAIDVTIAGGVSIRKRIAITERRQGQGKRHQRCLQMSIKLSRRIAAEMMGRGISKVRIKPDRVEDAKKAITREDVSALIRAGPCTR